ncbi:MAG: response regulator [Eubacteriales bacterium]|nr:response regulator [Eubacteriales bacterium]
MSGTYHVLAVEDEPLMRQYLADNLPLIHPSFVVTDTARDGLAALSLLEANHYDLIITDIRMPGLDGLALVERIRAMGRSIPVIILSGYDEFDYARTALRFGVSEYLLKPLKDEELHDTLVRLSGDIERHRSAMRLPKDLTPENISRFVASCFYETSAEQTQLIERAVRYITTHFTEPITQTDVAEVLGVTPAYLSSVFHEEKGESYSKFLVRLRMTQAALLLKSNPSMTIQRVAEQAGYSSDKHFIGVFKKYFGATPNEYRLRKTEE